MKKIFKFYLGIAHSQCVGHVIQSSNTFEWDIPGLNKQGLKLTFYLQHTNYTKTIAYKLLRVLNVVLIN